MDVRYIQNTQTHLNLGCRYINTNKRKKITIKTIVVVDFRQAKLPFLPETTHDKLERHGAPRNSSAAQEEKQQLCFQCPHFQDS